MNSQWAFIRLTMADKAWGEIDAKMDHSLFRRIRLDVAGPVLAQTWVNLARWVNNI